MSSFYLKQLKLAEDLEGAVICVRHLIQGDQGPPFVEMFLEPESPEFFWRCSNQVSLYPTRSKSLFAILNDDGKELYQSIKDLYLKSEPKKTFQTYSVCPQESGNWFADKTSKFWNEDFGVASIHSFENRIVLGKTASGEWFTTSPCIFIDTDEGWCFTRSGSFYKLETQMDYFECNHLMQNDLKNKERELV